MEKMYIEDGAFVRCLWDHAGSLAAGFARVAGDREMR